jgi:hypothetical protein
MTRFNFQRKGLRPLPALLLAGVLTLPMAACDTDELVAVNDPAQLRPEDLANAAAVPALVNGAFRQFVGGYSGFGDDSFLSASAVISDETYYGDTFTTREAADKRTVQAPVLTNISDASFNRLQQARFNARRAYAVVEQFTNNQTAAQDSLYRARLRTIEGFTYVTLSEGWCGAVPFSRVPDTGPIDPSGIQGGTPLNTNMMNDSAIARFDQALAFAPTVASGTAATNTNASFRRLAALGKARALLNLGKYAEAAAAVPSTLVPTTYVFRLEHSANVSAENNPMFQLQGNGRYGVSNLEGASTTAAGTTAFRPDAGFPGDTAAARLLVATAPNAEGIAFRGLLDPRVPFQGRAATNNACFSSNVTCWINNNYPTNDSDVPLASGVEARLIEAEAALNTARPADMITILNALRAQVGTLVTVLYPDQRQAFGTTTFSAPTLPALTDPATAEMSATEQFAARRRLMFQERALWLYNTGHRLGDLRRLIRNYNLPQSQVFPTGPHFRGGNYGTDVAYPVPFDELNNTNYNASQCVTSQA